MGIYGLIASLRDILALIGLIWILISTVRLTLRLSRRARRT